MTRAALDQLAAWFNSLAPESFSWRDIMGQDRWENFTPTRSGWTDVGDPVVSGRYRIIGRKCEFQIRVVPSTTVATTAGTSYVLLPVPAKGIAGDGSMANITTLIAIGVCVIDIANSRVYVPSQVATGNTLTIAGWYEA